MTYDWPFVIEWAGPKTESRTALEKRAKRRKEEEGIARPYETLSEFITENFLIIYS